MCPFLLLQSISLSSPLFNSSEHQIHDEQEGKNHGEKDYISTHASLPRQLLQLGRIDLELFGWVAYGPTPLIHWVQLVLIIKHFRYVAPHLPRDRIERLLNSSSLTLVFHVKICVLKGRIPVKTSLKFIDYVACHRVQRTDRLRISLEFGVALVKHIAHASQEIGSHVVGKINISNNCVGDHVAILKLVPRIAKVLWFGPRQSHLIILATQQSHAVVSNVLVLLAGDLIGSFARGEDCLITHPPHAHKVDLSRRNSIDHIHLCVCLF